MVMKKVALTFPEDQARHFALRGPIAKYLKSYDCEYDCLPIPRGPSNSVDNWKRWLSEYEHVFIYNGSNNHFLPIREGAEELGISRTYFDPGGLPSSSAIFVDREGILADSSLCRDISWVSDEHVEKLHRWKESYYGNEILEVAYDLKSKHPKDCVFCPLQWPNDANVSVKRNWSPFSGEDSMCCMIKYVQKLWNKEICIFKCHPRDIDNIDRYRKLMSKGNIILGDEKKSFDNKKMIAYLIAGARAVIGINSSVLLESLVLEVPTIALGEGYVKSCKKGDELRMAAAVKHRTLSIAEEDFPQNKIVLDEIHSECFWLQ